MALPGIRIGRAGMEKAADAALRGHAGAVQLEVNAVGRVIRELDRQEGTPGQDLGLTIDTALQKQVLARLGDESASAVVLDCRNGEVMALATNPSFDPSLFDSGVSQAQWVEWTRNRRTPLINKATAGVYPPGSTFKMAVALAALDAKTLVARATASTARAISISATPASIAGANTATARSTCMAGSRTAATCSSTRWRAAPASTASPRWRTGSASAPSSTSSCPASTSGLIPTREWRQKQGHPWQIGDTIVSGIGQGYIQVTPLQLATYVARVATGRAVRAASDAAARRRKLQPGSNAGGLAVAGGATTATCAPCARACSPW